MTKTFPMAYITAPGKVSFRERKLPELGTIDVLIKVKATAICGSDLHIFKGKHPAAPLPVTVGHEIAGQVAAIGPGVTRVSEGDRVAVEPVIVCGRCAYCRRGEYHLCTNISFQYRQGQGGLTPYFVADENWVHRLPSSLSYEEGALLEPLSVAVHAVGKSGLSLGESSAIFGDGAIGLLILLVAKGVSHGEIYVVGAQPHRLELASLWGASAVIDNFEEDALQLIHEGTSHMGVDRSFEAVGVETTLVQSLKALRKGGTAVLVGIFEDGDVNIPANLFIQREITLAGSQGYCWDFQTALKLLQDEDLPLGQLITHTFPLESVQDAFETLMDPGKRAVKVVIKVDE